jgi:hypothetical protein
MQVAASWSDRVHILHRVVFVGDTLTSVPCKASPSGGIQYCRHLLQNMYMCRISSYRHQVPPKLNQRVKVVRVLQLVSLHQGCTYNTCNRPHAFARAVIFTAIRIRPCALVQHIDQCTSSSWWQYAVRCTHTQALGNELLVKGISATI